MSKSGLGRGGQGGTGTREESAVTSYKGNSIEETWDDEVTLSFYLVILSYCLVLFVYL